MESQKHWWLYVLRLEQGKWYVGVTSTSPEKRFLEHKNKIRSAYWTMKYSPIEISDRIELGVITKEEAEEIENRKVRELLKIHGVNNVRGGDLRDTKDYVLRFGRIWIKEDWQYGLWLIVAAILIFAFTIDKYIYPLIPGGLDR